MRLLVRIDEEYPNINIKVKDKDKDKDKSIILSFLIQESFFESLFKTRKKHNYLA